MSRLVFASTTLIVVGIVFAAPVPKEKEDKPGPITDEQLKQSEDNLKRIGLGIHNYHDAMGFLPHNVRDGKKKPLLSWRVAVLPYIESDDDANADLYKQFKLDEAWDSETNKKLIEKLPQVYAPVRVKTREKGTTFYQAFAGKDTSFEPGKRLTIGGFTDGLSNTIGVVEAGEPVIWTKPDDLPFDAKKDLPKLGGLFDGDFHVLLMDGSVQKAVGKTVDADQFKLMVTRNDGMVVNSHAAFGHK